MRLAIAQPYLFPYPGYFDLMRQADLFVSLDNVQYIRRGWVNRNFVGSQERRIRFTFSVQQSPRETLMNEKNYASLDRDKERLKVSLDKAYRKHRMNIDAYQFVCRLLDRMTCSNVAEFNLTTLQEVARFLEIDIEFVKASDLTYSRADGDVLGICQRLGATEYINLPGGKHLYSEEEFQRRGISLRFLTTQPGPSILHYLIESI